MSDIDLMHHELAHALAGMLAVSGTEATITGGDDFWKTEHHWPADPGEFATVAAHVAGVVLAPEHASAEDRLFYAVLPADLRDRAVAFCMEVVAPVLADVSDAELARMAEKVERDGQIRLRRTRTH
jgi:hypothetical protein